MNNAKIQRVPLAAIMVALFFIAAGLVHFLLQDEKVYDAVKGVVKTYAVNRESEDSWFAYRVEEPFTDITNEKMIIWDASHYNSIREYLYRSPYDRKHCEYAFFPLFPLMWRATHLPPIGICILNIILFAAGLTILWLLFKGKMPAWHILLALCMPYLVIFAIPYSEALFFITVSAGLYGLVKRRYWLYFAGFMLAAMTRSASNILFVAWLITDMLVCLQAKDSWKVYLRNVALHLAPLAAGVSVVILIQWLCGATHPLQFVTSQGVWEKEVSLPSWPFTDWSVEGKSVTWPLIFTLFIPALIWLATRLFKSLKHHDTPTPNQADYQSARLLSVLFFVGNIVLALFTQGGCMYSQARLLSCTAFFMFLVFDLSCNPVPKVWRWIVGGCMLFTTIYCSRMLFHADSLGCIITLLLFALVFYHHWMPRWVRNTLIAITIALNIYWTAYLFNCFLNGGWIFT